MLKNCRSTKHSTRPTAPDFQSLENERQSKRTMKRATVKTLALGELAGFNRRPVVGLSFRRRSFPRDTETNAFADL
jgi:hypothetical protein